MWRPAVIIRLAGLMSRCTIPFPWAVSNPLPISISQFTISLQSRRPRAAISSARVRPSSHSITSTNLRAQIEELVDRSDRGVGEPGGRARLPDESVSKSGLIQQIRADHFQGHGPLENQIQGAVDDAHPAFPGTGTPLRTG